MDTLIVGAIVGLAVIYLVRRCIVIFRPRTVNGGTCGCADCNQSSACRSDAVQIRSRPD